MVGKAIRNCSKDKFQVTAGTQKSRQSSKTVFHLESSLQVDTELRFFMVCG